LSIPGVAWPGGAGYDFWGDNQSRESTDVFRYLSMAWQEPIEDDEPDTLKQLVAEMTRPRTFDEVMAEHDRENGGAGGLGCYRVLSVHVWDGLAWRSSTSAAVASSILN
jgi:hypothetical protein